jgi:hypothetical protein
VNPNKFGGFDVIFKTIADKLSAAAWNLMHAKGRSENLRWGFAYPASLEIVTALKDRRISKLRMTK